MARHAHEDLSFDVPNDWLDRSIIAFAAPPRPGRVNQANVVVTKERVAATQSLRTYASKQMTMLAQALPKFDLEEMRDVNVAGLHGIELRFTWEGESGPLAQRQIFVTHRGTAYSVTLSAPRSELAESSGTFDRIVASLHLPGVSGIRAS